MVQEIFYRAFFLNRINNRKNFKLLQKQANQLNIGISYI